MTIEEAILDIKSIYPYTLMLDKLQVAKLVNKSVSSLNRDMANSTGIEYKKEGGKVLYPVRAIAIWMSQTIITK